MTRRNFFAKLCAVATAPFAVKAVPKLWPVWNMEMRTIIMTASLNGETWILDPFTNNWRKWREGEFVYRIKRTKRKHYKI